MSVNGNPGSDLNAALLQAQQAASQATQGRGAPIFLGFGDVQLTQFKLPPGILGADNKIMKLAQAKPKLFDKVTGAMASAVDDFKKAAQGAGVMYSGDLPSGSMPGSGGSFTSMAQSHSIDDSPHIG